MRYYLEVFHQAYSPTFSHNLISVPSYNGFDGAVEFSTALVRRLLTHAIRIHLRGASVVPTVIKQMTLVKTRPKIRYDV